MTKIAQLQQQYRDNLRAMQSGVAMDQAKGSECGTPKHLRVGVNSTMVDHAALVQLLIKKGIISEEEFWESMVDASKAEKERYEELMSARFGTSIKLA